MGFQPTLLVVDEELYLQAVKTLHELENGESRFEMLTAARAYVKEPYLAARFAADMEDEPGSGWELTAPERDAIEGYIAGIYLPGHHSRYFEGIADDMDTYEGPTADFIRSAAWSFLCTWTHRYGPLRGDLNAGRTLIDPSVQDPER